MFRITTLAALFCAWPMFAWTVPAQAESLTSTAHLHADRITTPPIGWVQFCGRQPEECVGSGARSPAVFLTAARVAELTEVNNLVNTMVSPVTDAENYGVIEYWSYPRSNRGDCEDYVLLKRRLLIERGWPADALLITVVLDRDGGGHAVLTAVTDGGELILDNLENRVLNWFDTGLTFIKRQSAADPNTWLDLGRVLGSPLTASLPQRRLR